MAADEYFFEEGCFIIEMHNSPSDPAVSLARARVRPGETTRWHSLRYIHERYILLEGQGLAEIGDEPPKAVGPGDTVTIPPGVRQRITNTGKTDLLFLAVCTPRFVPEAYTDLDAS
jgi:mannose-6-phosphate isomerase-like protein (cupin superfamily)